MSEESPLLLPAAFSGHHLGRNHHLVGGSSHSGQFSRHMAASVVTAETPAMLTSTIIQGCFCIKCHLTCELFSQCQFPLVRIGCYSRIVVPPSLDDLVELAG